MLACKLVQEWYVHDHVESVPSKNLVAHTWLVLEVSNFKPYSSKICQKCILETVSKLCCFQHILEDFQGHFAFRNLHSYLMHTPVLDTLLNYVILNIF